MDKRRIINILYAVAIVPVMIAIFSMISSNYGKTIGYFIPYLVYLFLLLLGLILFNSKNNKLELYVGKHKIYYNLVAFIPALATFIVAFIPSLPKMSFSIVLFTLIYAIINGSLEELFWRYTFNKNFKDSIYFTYLLPTIIFTCWHIALCFAKGVTYHGGALALVGGAGFMGLLWG